MAEQAVAQEFAGEALEHAWLPASGEARATVIIVPTVMGVTDLERGFAAQLNEHGCNAFIADTFGKEFRGAARDVMFGELTRLRSDRAALKDRLLAILEVAKQQPGVQSARIAAIGFCFGGQCVLDLARTGADIAGVASFHGLFDPPGLPPQPIKAKVVAYHGWDDPMVPPDAVVALAKELTDAGADWQIHAYGHVGHGFTNPNATSELGIPGVEYDRKAARRSWTALYDFLDELFG
ncbi:dienelactone hydrolase family protein [Sphingomonas sp. BN140010]|uniref:Dienelactone hydrolase family protein n=1 Tax=Sphingomonas arvum TaxID=2992113 RepID=A0ABT3JBC8_9SPHN|nr:dienelactone hydrolase family protein [Sphingomonas sp. BN140010]MCW3796365.1 dienelactone hydrolase family protein [Sphingomonas sp. BN140010]